MTGLQTQSGRVRDLILRIELEISDIEPSTEEAWSLKLIKVSHINITWIKTNRDHRKTLKVSILHP